MRNEIYLTKREKEMLPLLTLTDEQIASKLFLTKDTVRTHIHNVLKKLKIKNKINLLIFALKLELINISDIVIQ